MNSSTVSYVSNDPLHYQVAESREGRSKSDGSRYGYDNDGGSDGGGVAMMMMIMVVVVVVVDL